MGDSISPENGPFESGLKMMGAQQQLAARSLINLIEMISTTSRQYAEETSAFTRDAFGLMQEAAGTRDPASLAELQQKWARTCLKYGHEQTRATMNFVEQCGKQALTSAAAPSTDTQGAKPKKPKP